MLNFKRSKWTRVNHGDAIVRQVAERCASAVLSQLAPEAQQVSVAELRGFARALAWPIICTEIEQYATNGGIVKTRREDLLAQVLEQTVHIVTQACSSHPIIAMPAPHIGRRAA